MKSRAFATVLILLAIGACTLSMSGCNTWKGAGKDVERTGEAMQGEDD